MYKVNLSNVETQMNMNIDFCVNVSPFKKTKCYN